MRISDWSSDVCSSDLADAEAIDKAEDRIKFRDAMDKIGLESARSGIAHTLDEAFAVLERTGLPSIIRPSFTMGGTGGGISDNSAELERIVRRGLKIGRASGRERVCKYV